MLVGVGCTNSIVLTPGRDPELRRRSHGWRTYSMVLIPEKLETAAILVPEAGERANRRGFAAPERVKALQWSIDRAAILV